MPIAVASIPLVLSQARIDNVTETVVGVNKYKVGEGEVLRSQGRWKGGRGYECLYLRECERLGRKIINMIVRLFSELFHNHHHIHHPHPCPSGGRLRVGSRCPLHRQHLCPRKATRSTRTGAQSSFPMLTRARMRGCTHMCMHTHTPRSSATVMTTLWPARSTR